MTAIYDVLIIGAGLAGSAIAIALAGRGWDVLLVERDRFPRHKVCGEFISPEAQTTLAALGLKEMVAGLQPAPIQQATLVTGQGKTLHVSLPGIAWGVSRYRLDAALATAAQQRGAQLCTETTVLGYEPTATGYTVHLRGKQGSGKVQARALIAAGGRHTLASLPPRARPPGRAQQRVGVKGHFGGVAMPAAVELFFFPGGYAGVSPIENGGVNLCLLADYAAFARAGRQIESMLDAVVHWNPALGRRLADGVLLPGTGVAVAPVDTGRPATPWDEIACVGDSAAMIPPLCGDGMAMALRSAELCAPLADAYLRGALSLAGWAEQYCRLWQGEFAGRLRTGRALEWALGQPLLANGLICLGQVAPPLASYLVQATRGQL
jgi:flavin-dependent dehydrogenase